MKRFYDPWVGEAFKPGSGLLVLSESAYKWEDGEPGPDHPSTNTVGSWSLDEERWDRPGKSRGVYARTLTRTLSGKRWPSLAERISAWNEVAYSIYVQRAMDGPNDRPNGQDFQNGSEAFLEILELLKPARVVVTGKQIWNSMPVCDVGGETDQGAYRLKSGNLSWCLAVPHPQSRNPRYEWQEVGDKIRLFRQSELPTS
ncbi:MAG: hypothetical protein JWQ49_3055 [Edaphobacter sp.]|nr:hypothetical protein [Edaphobacter sp.]